MLYIPKIGDIVKVNRMIGDDPKLLQNNQEVENIIKIDTTNVETYQVDLVGSDYIFTNHDLILISRSNNLLSVSNDSNTETVSGSNKKSLRDKIEEETLKDLVELEVLKNKKLLLSLNKENNELKKQNQELLKAICEVNSLIQNILKDRK